MVDINLIDEDTDTIMNELDNILSNNMQKDITNSDAGIESFGVLSYQLNRFIGDANYSDESMFKH